MSEQSEFRRRRVVIVQEWMPAYRVEFFEALRCALSERDIDLSVVYGNAPAEMAPRQQAKPLASGHFRRNRVLRIGRRQLVWQPWTEHLRWADLVVVNEGARFLLNYRLLARQPAGRCRVAFWGHGSHFDGEEASAVVEWGKRYLYRLPHWWFAYTEASRRRLVRMGVPEERTTVAQNALSTERVGREVADVDARRAAETSRRLGLTPGLTGLFLGSLYRAKRLDYLVEAADGVSAARPGFRLLIAGDGPDGERISRMVESRPYVRMLGHVEGDEKAVLLKLATFLLLPGAAGLGVLDAFAGGLPVVSAAVDAHGPELEYVADGENGRILSGDASPGDYAGVVRELLDDPAQLAALEEGARRSASVYTQAAMVSRFADGVEAALS
jgi:glycosyltransferase involved in cell wall biosynthesis